MDLCLRGSQINLAKRQKPKLTYNNRQALTAPHHPSHLHYRPRSANFIQQRSRSSPFLGRPQSADPKLGRKLSHYFTEKDFKNTKNRSALSSNDLLKSLIEEPIKRPWLCRSAYNSSTDEQSDFGHSQKSASFSSLTKRTPTDSVDGSSGEGGDNFGRCSRLSKTRMSSTSSISNAGTEKSSGYVSTSKSLSNDYWAPSKTSPQKTAKPDLPGRVSFSKPNMHNDHDSSDCDNDKPDMDNVSAPGPFQLTTNYDYTHKSDVSLGSAQKKTVHFGAPTSGNAVGSSDVLAETYEYPKCPSENCTCSTRSSSTASTHDLAEIKCACDAPICRYNLEISRNSSVDNVTYVEPNAKSGAEAEQGDSAASKELKVIREYKYAVGEQLENSVVKNLIEDNKTKFGQISQMNNIDETPGYLNKYASSQQAGASFEKQNNLSESKNLSSQYKSQAKCNLETEHNLRSVELSAVEKRNYSGTDGSTETVISNYLKVTSSPPLVDKKKENVKPASADTERHMPAKQNPKARYSAYNAAMGKPKSIASDSAGSAGSSRGRLKKAISVGSLRDDNNLNEYNLDKVDSWMSIHEQKLAESAALSKSMSENFGDLSKLTNFECGEDANDSCSQLSMKSDDNSQDSTYNEIVSVIKEIEEDKKRDNYAERLPSDLDLKLESRSETADSTKPNGSHEATKESPDKYKDMLEYLDNVEISCDKTLLETRRSMPDSNRSEIQFVVEPDITEDVPKLSDLLMVPNHQLARRVVALSLRANELANAIHLSKEHVIQLRNEKQKLIRAERAASSNKLKDQKKHYETVVTRHQGFIEQLLKDKGSLCEKVAALTRRLESQNQAWEHRLETELTRVKETMLASEKIKRERWVRENTKKIKELTVKGLEAEINKMNCEHQRELTELKRAHQQQLLDALEEARIKHEQIEHSIREACAQDRESIIEKERTAIRERFERQLDEERRTHDEQKQKLCDEFANERERLQAELRHKDTEYQHKRNEALREQENELEQAKFELQEKMIKQEEKYQNRINSIEKQYESDFEIWKREYENACKVAQVEKENAIRQHYRAERDRQLDELVVRMEADAMQCKEEHEQKIMRIKEKYEKDLADAENVEKSLREKYTETRTKLAESDAQVRNFQAEIKQLKIELEHSKKMCDDFLNERDQLRENLRNEIQNEVATVKKERDNEIDTLRKRVQQALGKKDAQIEMLENDNGNLRERILVLDSVIRQQRKDYCAK